MRIARQLVYSEGSAYQHRVETHFKQSVENSRKDNVAILQYLRTRRF